jgi:hypothetical protein
MWQFEHSAHRLGASFCRFSLLSCAGQYLGGTANAAVAAAEVAGAAERVTTAEVVEET